jgi:hypothetical protein
MLCKYLCEHFFDFFLFLSVQVFVFLGRRKVGVCDLGPLYGWFFRGIFFCGQFRGRFLFGGCSG